MSTHELKLYGCLPRIVGLHLEIITAGITDWETAERDHRVVPCADSSHLTRTVVEVLSTRLYRSYFCRYGLHRWALWEYSLSFQSRRWTAYSCGVLVGQCIVFLHFFCEPREVGPDIAMALLQVKSQHANSSRVAIDHWFAYFILFIYTIMQAMYVN